MLDKISRGRDYDKVRVLYLKETAIPFDGRTAFRLYDTYGFPFDLTQDLCREKGIRVDVSAYDTAMQEQRTKARAASKFSMAAGLEYSGAKTEFHGYDATTLPAKVVALYREGAQVQALKSGRRRHGGARSHAVLCRVGRPGRRPRRAGGLRRHLRGVGHAEDPGRGPTATRAR
jgi:alanyl-tRNA synthetase